MVVPDRVVQAQRLVALAPAVARALVLLDDDRARRRAGAAGRRARSRPGRRRRPRRTAGWSGRARRARARARSCHVTRPRPAPCSAPFGRRSPVGSSWPLSSCSAVSSVQARTCRRRRPSAAGGPPPRPTAVSKASHASVTPPASAGSSVGEAGRRGASRVARSRSATPVGPSDGGDVPGEGDEVAPEALRENSAAAASRRARRGRPEGRQPGVDGARAGRCWGGAVEGRGHAAPPEAGCASSLAQCDVEHKARDDGQTRAGARRPHQQRGTPSRCWTAPGPWRRLRRRRGGRRRTCRSRRSRRPRTVAALRRSARPSGRARAAGGQVRRPAPAVSLSPLVLRPGAASCSAVAERLAASRPRWPAPWRPCATRPSCSGWRPGIDRDHPRRRGRRPASAGPGARCRGDRGAGPCWRTARCSRRARVAGLLRCRRDPDRQALAALLRGGRRGVGSGPPSLDSRASSSPSPSGPGPRASCCRPRPSPRCRSRPRRRCS